SSNPRGTSSPSRLRRTRSSKSPRRISRLPRGGSKEPAAIVACRLAAMRLHVARDVADRLDAAQLVRVDGDLVAIAEDRDQLDHVDRVADDLADRSSERDLTLPNREGFAKGLEQIVAHVAIAR